MARGTIITDTLKDGSKRYRTVISVHVDGRRKQVWKTFDKKKEAEGYLDRNSTDVREGTYRELKKKHVRAIHRILEAKSAHTGKVETLDTELLRLEHR